MSIRRARAEDIETVLELCEQHTAFEGLEFQAENQISRLVETVRSDPPRIYIWVVEVEGQIQGYATASLEYSTWQSRDYLHLDCLFLRPETRGQGWGSRLLTTASLLAQELGCCEVQWQTPPWNERAIAFYEKLGARGLPKMRFSLPISQPVKSP